MFYLRFFSGGEDVFLGEVGGGGMGVGKVRIDISIIIGKRNKNIFGFSVRVFSGESR